ncbi:MAG: hypothetical protein ACKVZH_13165 [Blastocatellia bacterium]
MSLVMILLAIAAALMLWRDLKSGRVYWSRRYQKLDYDAAEPFDEKQNSTVFYWTVIGLVAVCCLGAFVMAPLLFFIPEDRLVIGKSRFPMTVIPTLVHCVYLVKGLMGRGMSWVKNHGSVDKKW